MKRAIIITVETNTKDQAIKPDASGGASFGTTVWPILTASNCNGSYCHGSSGHSSGLVMPSQTAAYSSLVGAASKGCPSLKRVEAGDAAKSYLIQKLEGKGSCFKGTVMPPGGGIATAKIATIKAWITAGAAK